MWGKNKVSVILPTFREKDSISFVINEFFHSGFVDEVIVVDNNAQPGTKEEVQKTDAKLIIEKKQGYGHAIQRGLAEASGDYLIISEPDRTFLGKDVIKLLSYSDDFDVVFGTRTTETLIWTGANMGFLMRWGNWFVAKLVEVLFNTTTLTDVGCTMKLIKKSVYENIKSYFSVGSSHFNPELMVLVILSKARFIEIPVNYRARVGVSSVTGNKWVAFWLGLIMLIAILKYRLLSWITKKYDFKK